MNNEKIEEIIDYRYHMLTEEQKVLVKKLHARLEKSKNYLVDGQGIVQSDVIYKILMEEFPEITSFKEGWKAHEEKSANDTIEFTTWAILNHKKNGGISAREIEWLINDDNRVCWVTTEQLYDIWLKTKQ